MKKSEETHVSVRLYGDQEHPETQRIPDPSMNHRPLSSSGPLRRLCRKQDGANSTARRRCHTMANMQGVSA